MPIHRLTEKEELLESDRICSIAFVSPWDREEAVRGLESPDFQPTVSFGHFTEEGKLTASLLLPQFQMRYEGHDVPMVGVGGVASLPEYRYGGAVRQIFHTALEWMWDQGAVFSSLYPLLPQLLPQVRLRAVPACHPVQAAHRGAGELFLHLQGADVPARRGPGPLTGRLQRPPGAVQPGCPAGGNAIGNPFSAKTQPKRCATPICWRTPAPPWPM